MSVFIAVLFTIVRKWSRSICLSTEGWITKVPYIDTTELWVAGKNKAMTFVGKWVELRDILK